MYVFIRDLNMPKSAECTYNISNCTQNIQIVYILSNEYNIVHVLTSKLKDKYCFYITLYYVISVRKLRFQLCFCSL